MVVRSNVVTVNTTEISTGAAVVLAGLRKSYGDVHAVAGVDLTIAPGEVVALLGPNGAGKSTAVDMLLGLTRPDAGTVTVFGASPHAAVATGTIGAMLQGGALLEEATVGEIVTMVASLHRAPMPVAEALRRSGVADLANRRGNKLSGGQKQRVRFAVALVSDPDQSPLTDRERDVLRVASEGGTIADVARTLSLSQGTVRNHLSAAIGKTGTRTRAEAARVAESHGWL